MSIMVTKVIAELWEHQTCKNKIPVVGLILHNYFERLAI